MSYRNFFLQRWTWFLLAVITVTLAFGVWYPAKARPLQELNVHLNPTSGRTGSVIAVSGSEWTPAPNAQPYEIHWNSKEGQLLGNFEPNSNGYFTMNVTVPSGAAVGAHDIWVCQRCDSAKVSWMSAAFTVLPSPSPTSSQPESSPTPTELPTLCDPTGALGEILIDFEDFDADEMLKDVTLPEGMTFSFHHPGVIEFWGARSGSQALLNHFTPGNEFGSAGEPLVIELDYIQDFVGVFVGLNEDEGHTFTASLTAYGEDEAGDPVQVGTHSETIGPGARPADVCLWVEAPAQILKVTVDYGPGATVGAPELIDDLVFRGPETPVPVPEDDQAPIVTIEEPSEGETVMERFVRLEGDITENRALDRVEVWVNGSLYKEIGAAWMGMTQYWFLDALDGMDLITCEENTVEVRAYDDAGNEGLDQVSFHYLGSGDLEIASIEAVQVVYDAPLVRGKGTAFRAKVNSTYSCPIETMFELELPDDQWNTAPPETDTLIVPDADSATDWGYPEEWGPVTISAAATEMEVILPYIPESEREAEWNQETNPAGIVKGGMVSGGLYLPDRRAVPRPVADNVTFAVEIDPTNAVLEQDESNNRMESSSYEVVTTRGFSFYVVPILQDGKAPEAGNFRIEEQIEFLLATYPISDLKISWAEANYQTMPCHDDPAKDCVWSVTAEGDVLSRIALMAEANGYDYAVGIKEGGGGSSVAGYMGGAFIGQGERWSVLAHEFNHSSTGMGDIYSLDCLAGWDEAYCEYPDGTRVYCCQEDAWGKPDGYVGLNCEYDAAGEVVCEEQTKECVASCDCSIYRRDNPSGGDNPCQETDESGIYVLSECNASCCRGECAAICPAGGIVASGPDDRIIHPASEGFWVNRWVSVDATSNYIMDISSGPSDPFWWMRLLNTSDHCEGNDFNDGYLNLLQNDNFITGEDPEVVLVSGRIHKSGEVSLDPFIYLPSANLDLAPDSEGDYYFELYDEGGELLGRTGFTLYFFTNDPDGGPVDESPFIFRIEWKTGTHHIILTDKEGNSLASRQVSQHSPAVTLKYPNGGEIWGSDKTYTIRWNASDEDNDPLSYILDISRDAGGTWFPIDVGLTDKEYQLDASILELGENYLVRVRALDGVNTGEDRSDGVFSVREEGEIQPSSLWLIGLAIMGFIGVVMVVIGVLIARKQAPLRR